MANELVVFRSVPEANSPVQSFIMEQLVDPVCLAALEQSFQEVVVLNDKFRALVRLTADDSLGIVPGSDHQQPLLDLGDQGAGTDS
jgi:hypothetical protein